MEEAARDGEAIKAGFGLQASGYRLPATSFRLPASGLELQAFEAGSAIAQLTGMPRDHSKLAVFQRAHSLTSDIYRLTRRLPEEERYGLSAQLRRAAVSVPANLVEGSARLSDREYQRFVEVALGSAAEVRYLLDFVVDLGYLRQGDVATCRECSDHVVRELQNLLTAVARFRL